MAPRDPARPKGLLEEADDGFLAAVNSLTALAAGDLPTPTSWWRRRRSERELDGELRQLGLRVVLSEGGAVLLDPTVREQATELRARWQELHPGMPVVSSTPTKDLLASVAELVRRLTDIERMMEARAPQPRFAARPAAAAASPRAARRAARRR